MPGPTLSPDTKRRRSTTLPVYACHLTHARLIDTDLHQAAQIVTHIRHEINLHISECQEFGLCQADMEQHEESQGQLHPIDFDNTLTLRSLHCLYPLRSRHWPVGRLACSSGCSFALSARLRHDRAAAARDAGYGSAQATKSVLVLDQQLHCRRLHSGRKEGTR